MVTLINFRSVSTRPALQDRRKSEGFTTCLILRESLRQTIKPRLHDIGFRNSVATLCKEVAAESE